MGTSVNSANCPWTPSSLVPLLCSSSSLFFQSLLPPLFPPFFPGKGSGGGLDIHLEAAILTADPNSHCHRSSKTLAEGKRGAHRRRRDESLGLWPCQSQVPHLYIGEPPPFPQAVSNDTNKEPGKGCFQTSARIGGINKVES